MPLIAASNTYPISASQAIGLISGNRDLAVKLDSWGALRDFFMQLINLLPGVDLLPQSELLATLFDKSWPEGGVTPGDPDLACRTLEGLSRFFGLYSNTKADNFTLKVTHNIHDEKTLHIDYVDPTHPNHNYSTHLAFSAQDNEKIDDFLALYTKFDDSQGHYNLDKDKFDSNRSEIVFIPIVNKQFRLTFELYRCMADCNRKLNQGIRSHSAGLYKLDVLQRDLDEIAKDLEQLQPDSLRDQLTLNFNQVKEKYNNFLKDFLLRCIDVNHDISQKFIARIKEFRQALKDIIRSAPQTYLELFYSSTQSYSDLRREIDCACKHYLCHPDIWSFIELDLRILGKDAIEQQTHLNNEIAAISATLNGIISTAHMLPFEEIRQVDQKIEKLGQGAIRAFLQRHWYAALRNEGRDEDEDVPDKWADLIRAHCDANR